MQYCFRGVPDLWAIIDGEPYIVGECGWDVETDTEQTYSGVVVVSAQTISGFAKLFGKKQFDVFDEHGVPDPITMEMLGNGELVRFQQTLFSSFERMPHYDNVAVEVEWVAERMDREQSEDLYRVGA